MSKTKKFVFNQRQMLSHYLTQRTEEMRTLNPMSDQVNTKEVILQLLSKGRDRDPPSGLSFFTARSRG